MTFDEFILNDEQLEAFRADFEKDWKENWEEAITDSWPLFGPKQVEVFKDGAWARYLRDKYEAIYHPDA